MLYSLQYLRGLASILVVLYHCKWEMNNAYEIKNLGTIFFGNGYIGVDLFFMISGFVIMLSTERDNSVFSFILKRLFRIYPVYLACLLFSVTYINKTSEIDLINAILFINLDLHSNAPWFGYAIVFTAWTLMFEAIFYIIFAISMTISNQHRGLISSCLIICITTLLNLIFNDGIKLSGYDAIPIASDASSFMQLARVLSSPMFYEFSIGIFIYYLYSNNVLIIDTKKSKVILVVSIISFLAFYITGVNGGHGILSCGIFSAFLLFGFVMYEKYNKIKKNATLMLLGNISYSLYLTHPIIMNILSTGLIMMSAYTMTNGIYHVLIILISSMITSTFLYYFIELPCVKGARIAISTIKPARNI
ncbi:TPA: acyltransferase family protein [Citrobacter amalonaticus]|uniref:acyltransferase family protein n=1 Tax=Citrobacter amalonaticus TaxID=35703 RepID=UPI001C95A481|nr:acyltransferase [Citrobacter amalonaticus]MBY5256420.1 acyltransferase [Citrobacter amalonaticus]HCL5922093.1 acyltransferase [Citrobacter amalonaticus]